MCELRCSSEIGSQSKRCEAARMCRVRVADIGIIKMDSRDVQMVFILRRSSGCEIELTTSESGHGAAWAA